MSMIYELKEKAAGYLNDFSKKKDELVEKAALLKNEHEESQRKKREDWVYKKELELKEFEKELEKREKLIRQNELKLKKKFVVRFIGVAAGLSAIGFLALASFIITTENGNDFIATQAGNDATKSPASNTSEPYTRRESAVYSTYDDLDATNPNFDVGNYCLEKEKKGGISFEECLSVAAAKIMSQR